jgi:phage/plasmid-like protein (TIGR03299 family)
MPANVETLAYAGERPWHGVGTLLPDAVDKPTMLAAAGLDWSVGLEPLYVERAAIEGFTMVNNFARVDDYMATVRMTDRRVLGVVSKGYKPVQNEEVAELAVALMDFGEFADPVRFEVAGALDGGRRVFFLARIPQQIILRPPALLGGDLVENYMNLWTAHDGTAAVHATPTFVRVVCENTLNYAEQTAKAKLRIIHTGSIRDKVGEAQRLLGIQLKTASTFGEWAQFLTQQPANEADATEFGAFLYPMETPQQNRSRAAIASNFTVECEYQGANAWGLLNAATGETDHQRSAYGARRGRSAEETRYGNLMTGTGARRKQDAIAWIDAVYVKNETPPQPRMRKAIDPVTGDTVEVVTRS